MLVSSGVKSNHAYSDACGGQNRNHKMVMMWMHIVNSLDIETVDHYFMASGHSYLPNDQDFGVIERAKPKTQEVFVPAHWHTIIETAKRCSPKFKVVKMASSD